MTKLIQKTTAIAAVAALALSLSACADLASNNTDHATVYFETGKHHLTAESKNILNQFAASVKNQEVAGASVTGFADRRGSDKANYALSQRRAKTVAAYLTAQGVASVKTAVVTAVGKTQPTTECEGVKGHAATQCLSPDRKVEVQIDTVPVFVESGSNAARNHSNLQDRHHYRLK